MRILYAMECSLYLLWLCGVRCQSSNYVVVGVSPPGGKQLAIDKTFSGQSCKKCLPLATHFTPLRHTQVIKLGYVV